MPKRKRPQRTTTKPARYRSEPQPQQSDSESEPPPEPPTSHHQEAPSNNFETVVLDTLKSLQNQINTLSASKSNDPTPTPSNDQEPNPIPSTSQGPNICYSPLPDYQDEGEPSDSDDDSPHYSLPATSFGHILGSAVKSKLKAKILKGSFIEMSELLPRHSFQDQAEEMRQGRHNNNQMRNRPPPNVLFPQWCEVFDIYTAVLMEKSLTRDAMLNDTRSLLTYKKTICNLRRMNYDWQGYDRHYHMEHKENPIPWHVTRQDLMLQYETSPFRPTNHKSFNQPFRTQTKHNRQGNLRTKQGNFIPRGHCITFHSRNQHCNTGASCSYQHKCPRCSANHPVYTCKASNTTPKTKRQGK